MNVFHIDRRRDFVDLELPTVAPCQGRADQPIDDEPVDAAPQKVLEIGQVVGYGDDPRAVGRIIDETHDLRPIVETADHAQAQ